MDHLHFIDYCIILVVLGITLYMGFRFAKKEQTTENFFLSKGDFPSWALGLSLLSTLISSVTFLGYPAQGYSGNWILLVQGLMVPVVLLGTIWFIVPLFRKVIGLSTYEYFEKRFGGFARYYSSSSFIIRQFAGMGTVLFLAGGGECGREGGVFGAGGGDGSDSGEPG
jgi:SSS family solute:Na+ symporter